MSKALRRDLARALELHRAGRLAQAEQQYASYLASYPEDPAALNNAAALAMQTGNAELAIARLDKLVALDPRHAQGYNNLGYALIQGGRPEEAAQCLERAVEIDPAFALAHNNLGMAYEALSRRADAIRAFERALALQSPYADAAANLGEVLSRDGDTAGARAALRRALQAQPTHVGARVALAAVDAIDGKLDESLAVLERIVPSMPRQPLFWETLGVVRTWSGDLVGAEMAFRSALKLAPHHRPAWFGLAASQLGRGDFARGWEAFERRPDGFFGAPTQFRDLPQWDGRPLDGALLIVGEQGLGDVVQFARLVPEARSRVRRLIFVADGNWRTLASLLATLRGIDDLCTDVATVDALPEQPAARASVLSLPYLLGLRLEALPGPVPYLSALDERTAPWRPRLDAIPRPRIGLVWAAYARRDIRYITHQKSVPPELLTPVIAASGASFVSLQLGASGEHAPAGELATSIMDLTTDILDFGDTAAIISELDLVISSDTSVAHVAGAMGKPVWMLDRFNTCWRWRLDSDSSPWYPTMRIFRQREFGDWREPIARVSTALERFCDT